VAGNGGADAVFTGENAIEPKGAIGRTRRYGRHESHKMSDALQVRPHLNAHRAWWQRRRSSHLNFSRNIGSAAQIQNHIGKVGIDDIDDSSRGCCATIGLERI